MAAMDLARSLSGSPSSATQESFRARAASPEPHYRLSRLNTPPQSATLRPPSVISRSVSANFSFKSKDVMDERPPSRSIFKLRKKGSLASMVSSRTDDSALSRTASAGPSILSASPVHETPPQTPTLPPLDHGPEDARTARPKFTPQEKWRMNGGVKTHPYNNVPYMQSFESVDLENERYTHQLLRRLLPDGSPTFHNYKLSPPQSVLELGCGAGAWLLDAARTWRATQFVGLDIVNVAVPALTDGTVPNVRLQLGDFLNYPLPFRKNSFELVRMANLALCVPSEDWEKVLREVNRVLVPGGRLELIDDQTIFPYGDAPAEEAPDAFEPSADLPTPTVLRVSPSTPRPPPTPDSSAFFDSDSDDESDESKTDSSLAATSDSASEWSSGRSSGSFTSTLVGEPSERGSVELKKPSELGVPQIEIESVPHRPFSGVDHLIISIPPPVPLVTVDICVDSTPLTPVPTSRGTSPPLTAASLDASSSSSDSPPASPSTVATELADEGSSGPWSSRATASRDVERVFARMLKHSGFDARPHDIFPDALEAVFSHVDIPASMHLKLAPPNAPERNDLAHQGIPSRRKKERTAKTPTSIEFPTETAIPQGLSAKAAERLGIASPGACAPTIRRQRTMSTLTGTPEESEDELSEDDAFSSDGFSDSDGSLSAVSTRSPLERGASDWVAPDAWSGPATDNPPIRPPLQRMGSAPLLSSSSSKTITPSMSNKTITASSSSRTVKLASSARTLSQKPLSHTRNGSVASTASAQSTASASSYVSLGSFNEQDPGPQRYSEKTVQHPGLILWPSTFIPMPPQELQYHATKHAQTVLGCKPALEQFVKTFVDPVTEERYVSEKEFEDAMWDYESFLRPRFNWPQLAEARLEKDDDVDDLATPQSATFGPMSGFSVPGPVVDSRGRVTHPFGPHDLTHVRTFRVFGATKVGAGSALRKPTV